MKKAGVLSILFVVILLAVAVPADAQQPKNVPRVVVPIPVVARGFAAGIEANRPDDSAERARPSG
jgi:hypothetical protein